MLLDVGEDLAGGALLGEVGGDVGGWAGKLGGQLREALGAAGEASAGTTVVVSSGGVIGALAVALIGVDPISFPRLNRVTINCGITRVIIGSAGTTLVSFNEQGHLSVGERTYR